MQAAGPHLWSGSFTLYTPDWWGVSLKQVRDESFRCSGPGGGAAARRAALHHVANTHERFTEPSRLFARDAVHIVSYVSSMLATLPRGGGVETMCRAHPRAWVSEPSEAKLLEGTQRRDGTRPWAHGCCWHVRHDFALSSATVLAAPISVSRCGRHPGTPPMVVSRSTLAALHGRPRLASYRPCGRG